MKLHGTINNTLTCYLLHFHVNEDWCYTRKSSYKYYNKILNHVHSTKFFLVESFTFRKKIWKHLLTCIFCLRVSMCFVNSFNATHFFTFERTLQDCVVWESASTKRSSDILIIIVKMVNPNHGDQINSKTKIQDIRGLSRTFF